MPRPRLAAQRVVVLHSDEGESVDGLTDLLFAAREAGGLEHRHVWVREQPLERTGRRAGRSSQICRRTSGSGCAIAASTSVASSSPPTARALSTAARTLRVGVSERGSHQREVAAVRGECTSTRRSLADPPFASRGTRVPASEMARRPRSPTSRERTRRSGGTRPSAGGRPVSAEKMDGPRERARAAPVSGLRRVGRVTLWVLAVVAVVTFSRP